MRKIKKYILISAISLIILILFAVLYYFTYGNYIETDSLCIYKLNVLDDSIEMSGDTSNSAKAFTGYNYKIKDGNLYIKFRYSLVSYMHRLGEYNIKINNISKVNNIYLQGANKDDKKLIWKR